MDIHQLQLFLAVMDSPSMTRAAEKIHLSPGAVSLQLHNLAEELDTELFVRRGKRLIPTPAALRLAEHAKEVVKKMSQIHQEFENDLAKDVRPFHFATGVTTLIYQLGRPLRELRKRFPNAEINVTVGVTEEMVAGLLDRRFDLALISLPVPEENLTILPLFDEELLIVRPSANKSSGGHVGTLRAPISPVPLPSLSETQQCAAGHRPFFQGARRNPARRDGGRRHRSDKAPCRVWLRLFHSSRARPPRPLSFLSKIPRRRPSPDEKPGPRHASHPQPKKADGIHRQFSSR